MKTIPIALQTHLNQEVTTLCTCWKAILTNGTIYGFTDNTTDLVIEGVNYIARAGYTPTAIATSNQFNVDNMEVEAILSDDAITDADLLAGLWDFAEIQVFNVNYKNVTEGVIQLRKGWLGEITIKGNFFTAELRGLMQKLQENIGRVYAPTCDATFGDARCGINLTPFTFTGAVQTVISQTKFTDALLAKPTGYFNYGLITWLTGANAGRKMEVKTYAANEILLQLPMSKAIVAGDTYTAIAGCSKRFIEDCRDKYNNAVNFRGFPHVPGTDNLLKGPTREL